MAMREAPQVLADVARLARGCRRCPLWRPATQTVFGEGPVPAPIMLVGEEPGDREDREGRPFVGPAGRLLHESLGEAGIDPGAVFRTNVVKHFKFHERGRRRIHQRPSRGEVVACRPWLDEELAFVRPEILVALGATAARELFGTQVSVTRDRGVPFDSELAPRAMVTVHPSSILRAAGRRREARAAFVADLRVLAALS